MRKIAKKIDCLRIREIIKDIEGLGGKVYITENSSIIYKVVIDYGQYIIQYLYEEEIYNFLSGFYYGIACKEIINDHR
jgi:hypothetical protein